MNFLQAIKSQFNRIFGTNSATEEMTESEFIDVVEQMPTIADITKANADMSEQIQSLQTNYDQASELAKSNIEKFAAMEASLTAMQENLKDLEEKNASLTSEINSMKIESTVSGVVTPADPAPTETKKEEDKSTMSFNFQELTKKDDVLNGLF